MTSEEKAFFNGFHQGMAKGRDEEEEKRAELIRQAIRGEREACAKLCDEWKNYFGYQCANAIRNGKSPVTGASDD